MKSPTTATATATPSATATATTSTTTTEAKTKTETKRATSRLINSPSALRCSRTTSAVSSWLHELAQQGEHEPTSAILNYCKRKFLRPYVAILTMVGLNPISTDMSTVGACSSYVQALMVFFVLLAGYVLRYLCGYRGDRGFSSYRDIRPGGYSNGSDVCGSASASSTPNTIGELLFGYVVPSALNLLSFVSAVLVCKVIEHEQLQNLIERVFLLSAKPKRLCRMLWLYLGVALALLLLLFGYACCVVFMQQSHIIKVDWLAEALRDWELWLRLGLLSTILLQDLVEIIVLSSYYIECYLLRVHLETLSHKLLMHSIDSLDWMREILEFRKLLERVNQHVSIPVCFLIVMNLAYAFAGLVYLFKDFDFHYCALKMVLLNIANVMIWLFLGLLPFFVAGSVTRVCQNAQANGHQIRVRPFVYHNTSAEDLNSTLLFASSLDMSAKLFRMPIQSNYLCFAILVVTIVVLTLGMCLNLSVLGKF
ncbi:uncharacterized protein LOC108654657 isoform X1 [Drosophila navojoa]|uniref:uncharacterized protein LOC108654657 isoform X1 n=1 Tax=Drosophila navojoa TaxID=7232 RepID=UPI0011BFA1FE|nr:uncharacterized protein LOC108654657 isoform X1 [Drosophila navojoa]